MNETNYEKIHTSKDGTCVVTISYQEAHTIENAHGTPVRYPESWTLYVSEIYGGEAQEWETVGKWVNPTQPIVVANTILQFGYEWATEFMKEDKQQ